MTEHRRRFDGYAMRQIRKEEDISMQELAARIGVQWQQIYRWEMVNIKPNADYLAAIADALNCQIDNLYSYK